MTPRLSIVIPCYRVAEYLPRCLDSLAAQTFRDYEVIAVDDGSPDDTGAVLDAYAARDARIRVIHQPNGGVARARNAGLEAVRAPFLTFVDPDDHVEPEFCRQLYEAIAAGDVDLAVCGVRCEGDSVRARQLEKRFFVRPYAGLKDVDDRVFLETDPCLWNKAYRMDLIRANGLRFPNGLVYEDCCFHWQYLAFVKKVRYVSEPLYWYFQRPDGIIGATAASAARYMDEFAGFLMVRRRLEPDGHWDRMASVFARYVLNELDGIFRVLPEELFPRAYDALCVVLDGVDVPQRRRALENVRARACGRLVTERRLGGVVKIVRTLDGIRIRVFGVTLCHRPWPRR